VRTPITVAPDRTSRATVALAWVATLALSRLVQIVLVEAVGIDTPPMLWIWLALAALLLVAAGIWEAARPLRGYFTVMAAVIAALYLVLPLVWDWAGVEASSGMIQELKVRGSLFVVALGLAAGLPVPGRGAQPGGPDDLGVVRAGSLLRRDPPPRSPWPPPDRKHDQRGGLDPIAAGWLQAVRGARAGGNARRAPDQRPARPSPWLARSCITAQDQGTAS
jgi:hypothetical protein